MSQEKPVGYEDIKVLVVDDESYMLQAWQRILENTRCQLKTLSDAEEVLPLVESWRPDVVVLDIRMPRVSGLDLLREIKRRELPCEVVMMTAYASVETAVEAVKSGAYDYLTKPFANIEEAALTVLKAGQHNLLVKRNRELENLLNARNGFEGLVGSSGAMKRVFELIDGVAYSSSTVLIEGESGTGKELVARAIHHRSPRRASPFVVVNCSALTETLIESELFGHEKGAFTGAVSSKRGLFEVADGGTIFLDEVGEIPLPTQVKLLRVLQEGEVKRVGSSETRKVDVRVVAATNVDLRQAVKNGSFRDDLYYRLCVINIKLPPLRERGGDVPLLAYHFLRKYNERTGKHLEGIDPQALEALEAYHWPGNVRELENVIERAVVLGRGSSLGLHDLPEQFHQKAPPRREALGAELADLPYKKAKAVALGEFHRHYFQQLILKTQGNLSKAARLSQMDRSNFRRLLKRFGGVVRTAGMENGESK
jgi:DNA-binding NtrC family response regulator